MSMIGVDYGVLNQRGSPSWFSDIYANIPTAGYKGRMFISTDTFAFYRDTGTGWDLIGGPGTGTITGSGASGQVSYFNGSSTLAGSNNLFWDSTNNRLGIGTATPGVALDIHATGTNAQFNGTGSSNAYIVFQQAGTSKWRIGNTFSSPNSFDIYNNATTTNALSISSSNILSFIGVSNFDDVIRLKQNLSSYATSSGYTTMFSTTGGGLYTLGFYNGAGALSQISFTTAASYSYTFPNASGTLALTSNLSSYLPLAGGTMSGSIIIENGLGTNQIYLTKSSGDVYGTIQTEAGGNKFSLGNVSNIGTLGTPNITWTSGMQVGINNTSPTYDFDVTGTGRFTGILRLGSTLSNGTYFYTLPSATGTLALTSALSSYLPLTGGTLTGQLYINPTNTATTGLDVASDNISFRSDNLEGFKRQLLITMGSGTLIQFTAQGYGANYGTDLAFYTATTSGVNSSPAIYITGTNNRVGIKTGTPDSDLQVAGTCKIDSTFTSVAEIVLGSSGSYPVGGTGFRNDGTNLNIYYGSNNCIWKDTTNVERMRITSGGVVGINQTTDPYNHRLTSNGGTAQGIMSSTDTTGNDCVSMWNKATSGNNSFTGFYVGSGVTGVGNIIYNRSAGLVVYNTTSDYRLKSDITDFNGLNIVINLKPKQFRIRDSKDKVIGFIAHELKEFFPQAVIGEKDQVKEDGTPIYQSVDYSQLSGLLVKAIQELNEKLVRNNIN